MMTGPSRLAGRRRRSKRGPRHLLAAVLCTVPPGAFRPDGAWRQPRGIRPPRGPHRRRLHRCSQPPGLQRVEEVLLRRVCAPVTASRAPEDAREQAHRSAPEHLRPSHSPPLMPAHSTGASGAQREGPATGLTCSLSSITSHEAGRYATSRAAALTSSPPDERRHSIPAAPPRVARRSWSCDLGGDLEEGTGRRPSDERSLRYGGVGKEHANARLVETLADGCLPTPELVGNLVVGEPLAVKANNRLTSDAPRRPGMVGFDALEPK